MITSVDAESFFGNNRPLVIPSDAPSPEWELLINRTQSLDPSLYPNFILKSILEYEHNRLEACDKTIEKIRSIDDNTVFVVCGQQAGLFGGPLYTLYKAMHAVQLSYRLSMHTGRNVIPLFWIASDDHDFDEVKSLGVMTRDGKPFSIDYAPANYTEGSPIGTITLDKGITNAIDTLAKHLPSGMYAQRYLDMIRSAWQPDRQWADAFAAHLTGMFAGTGLVLLDPRWKGIKELFKVVFFAELSDPLASTVLVNREADKITSRLKNNKVLCKHEGSTNLFIEMEGVRHPLNFSNNEFTAGEHPFSKSELFDLVDSDPERFSPAAALRPVCQDAVLPVAALISGPGEHAYLSQVRPLYAMFGVDGSLLWPRASFTLIDQRTIRTARKEKLELSKLFENLDSIHTKLTWNTFPEDVKHKLDSIDQTVRSGFESLAEGIGSIDPTLVKSVEKGKGKALHIIKEIRERALRSHKAKTAVSETRLASASYFLRPKGSPQERWFGADSILPLLEDEEFKKFITLTSPNEEYHRIIIME